MVTSGRWYEVVVHEVRQLEPDRLAILGELRDQGELLSPWGVLVRVRNGLIVESRSYLSDNDLLESLSLIGEPPTVQPGHGGTSPPLAACGRTDRVAAPPPRATSRSEHRD